MKKKTLAAIFALVAIPSLINFLILKKYERLDKKLIKSKYYSHRHGDVHYTVSGKGEPLVLIHGIGAGVSYKEWENNISALSKKYRVYCIDLLGFGYSDRPKLSYSSYIFVNLIRDFIKNVVGQPVNAVGSSNSAAYLVMASQLEPKCFKKLMLINPTGVGTSNQLPTNKDSILRTIFEIPVVGTSLFNLISSKYYSKRFLKKYVFGGGAVSDKVVDDYYYMSHLQGVNSKYTVAAFITKFLNISLEHRIPYINIETLVLWGENNLINPVENIKYFKGNEKISVAIMENTKLLPHYENPKEFNRLVKEFF